MDVGALPKLKNMGIICDSQEITYSFPCNLVVIINTYHLLIENYKGNVYRLKYIQEDSVQYLTLINNQINFVNCNVFDNQSENNSCNNDP